MRGVFAATELDKLWNCWARNLSDSYVRTLRLLESGQHGKASDEFQGNFHTEIKKVYSEAASTAPERFVDNKDWSAWLRHVYALSVKANRSLRAASKSDVSPEAVTKAGQEATASLRALRKCFHVLHTKTNTLRCGDYIYDFHEELLKDTPDLDQLKTLRKALDDVAPSPEANAEAEAFHKAKTAWATQVDPILAGGKIQRSERDDLRAATTDFYQTYGERFD